MKFKILVVDDEPAIRAMLVDFLETEYEVDDAENGDKALAKVATHTYDLVISDINMPGIKGYELLHKIKQIRPLTKTVLITAYNVDEYVKLAREYNICNIVAKTSPFNFKELEMLVRALTTGEIFGLERYLDKSFKLLGTFRVHKSDEVRGIRAEVMELLPPLPRDANEVKLVVDEIITNAIYHAPREKVEGNQFKAYAPIELAEEDKIEIAVGHDLEKVGISITDYHGNLDKDKILFLLDRHVNSEGIMDESGRGIFMSRIFSDRLIINIQPGIKTEVIILFYFEGEKFKGFKPLYIHQL